MRHLFTAVACSLLVAGCGGGSHPKAAPATTHQSASGSDQSSRGICGSPTAPSSCVELTFDDIPDGFGGWPELKRAFRDGRRYDLYTSLAVTAEQQAANLCDSVYSDLLGQGQQTPEIVTWSRGNPPTILAIGASPGVGCTPIHG
jgi:hypothetical protein